MANQRKKGKKLVGAFVEGPIHDALQALAEARGVTMADIVKELVDQKLETELQTRPELMKKYLQSKKQPPLR